MSYTHVYYVHLIRILFTYIGMLDLEPYRFRKRPSHSTSSSTASKGNKGGHAATGTGHWLSEYRKWKGVYDTYDWTQYYQDTAISDE